MGLCSVGHSTSEACNKWSKRVSSSVPSSSSSISAQNPNTTTLFPISPQLLSHLNYLTLRRVLHTLIITDGFLHFLLFTSFPTIQTLFYFTTILRTNVRKGTCVRQKICVSLGPVHCQHEKRSGHTPCYSITLYEIIRNDEAGRLRDHVVRLWCARTRVREKAICTAKLA